jgi:hypothetical protein
LAWPYSQRSRGVNSPALTSSTTTGAKLFDAALAANATAPLTARGLRNEIAFTRLFGHVRYFHPSDESAAADWEALAVQGARTVEAADDDTALAKALAALLQPVSPTLRISLAGQDYTPPSELNVFASGAKYVYWRHFGLGTGVTPGSIYSRRE